MEKEKFLEVLKATRRDLSDYLFHFTKGTNGECPFDILKKIIKERKLIGSNGYIRGGHNCVCFSEAPLHELISYFNLEKIFDNHKNRYSPYGFAFKKQSLFEKGCRPVIYQDELEYTLLSEELKYKHVTFSPEKTDFSWEREWRLKTDLLHINPNEVLIIVPSFSELYEIISHNQEFETEYDYEYDEDGIHGIPIGLNSSLELKIISLDLFGLKS